jgi:hypothetical protein
MIRRCSICGELRTLVPTHARCWVCAAKDIGAGYEPPPACLDGIDVLRVIERRDGKFELLYAVAPSNVAGMMAASIYFGMVEMIARPIWSVTKIR